MQSSFWPGRVLCALDVEAGPRGPLAMASVLAQHFDASLDGLHAVAPATDWGNRVEKVRRLIAEHNARERLESLLAPLTDRLEVESFITRGPTSEVILNHATRHRADLIVLGGSPDAPLESAAGRVVSSVAAGADCAVLSVPGDTAQGAIRRILLPISSVAESIPATIWATTLAKRFGASVGVVRVNPVARGFWSTLLGARPEARASAEPRPKASIDQVLQSLRVANVVAVRERLELDTEQVAATAAAAGYDLVVVGLSRAAGRDTTGAELLARLRRDCRVPTLSVRAVAGASKARRGQQAVTHFCAELRASA